MKIEDAIISRHKALANFVVDTNFSVRATEPDTGASEE
jgi:hypothetical protein